MTCRYVKGKRLIKTCVKIGRAKAKCKLARRAKTAARLNGGFVNRAIPAVGRFYSLAPESTVPDKGWCSGTLLTNGIVLTAAHCLYQNTGDDKATATPHWFPFANGKLQFVPGNSATTTGGIHAPYGVWNVADVYVPGGWQQNNESLDWGLVLLEPDANGNYPGPQTGTFAARWNADIRAGAFMESIGYPASGGFRTPLYAYGKWQYFCDNSWDDGASYFANTSEFGYNQGFWFYLATCEMNGGSSGGPVLAKFGNEWQIVAVNNRGAGTADNRWGRFALKIYFDSRFGEFWNGVINAINARPARRAGRGADAAAAVGLAPPADALR